MTEYSDNLTDKTKAPERIWLCMSESTEDGLAWVARAALSQEGDA